APTVGWIGTGRMGLALAARLVRAGYDVAAWNRTRAKAEPLAELGAALAGSPAELAGRDVVFIMVSADKDLEAVPRGAGGPPRARAVPPVLAASSPVPPQAPARIRGAAAARGAGFLAAPVSGTPKVIAAGKLTVAVSGPPAAFEAARPLLEALGRG